jgi:hypothetical protein
LASSYSVDDHRVRDSLLPGMTPLMTFAPVLKHNKYQLPEFLEILLNLTKEGLGCDVEIEFAANMPKTSKGPLDFVLLQARPMTVSEESLTVNITEDDLDHSICHSTNALGRGVVKDITDVILVKHENFSSKHTVGLVKEISRLNGMLEKDSKKYILIGPGRWGSSDPCLGIPVGWQDISGVGGIVEASTDNFRPDPSQGTHFFQNITSLGIPYFTVYDKQKDGLEWDWFKQFEPVYETEFIAHYSLKKPLLIKIDGKKNFGVISNTST